MKKPAFRFPFPRKPSTSAPALPPASPRTAAPIVPATAAPIDAPKFSFRNFGKRRKAAAASNSIAIRGAQSREIVRSDTRGDTLGGIFAKSLAPGVGASVGGFMDGTPISKALQEATGGAVNLSDVAMVAGALARGSELDGKVPLVGAQIKRMNTAFLSGIIPAKFYNAGRRGAEHLFRDKGKTGPAAPKSDEPVPGEMTVS